MSFWPRFTAVAALLLTLSCSNQPVAGEADFHPRGRTALTPTDANPDQLPVSGEFYIPVYSDIYWGQSSTHTDLSATLSIRNTDSSNPLILLKVDYYNSIGEKIRGYLEAPAELAPMATVDFVIAREDRSGGSGANFSVGWAARGPITEPVMESVMLGQVGSRGVSFLSPGRAVKQIGETE